MKCPNCNKEMGSWKTLNHCPKCGYKLDHSSETEINVKKKKSIVLPVVLLLLLIVIFTGAGVFLHIKGIALMKHEESENYSSVITTESDSGQMNSDENDGGEYYISESETECKAELGFEDLTGENQDSTMLCPELSEKYFTELELRSMVRANNSIFPGNRSFVQMLLNEIYAKNGYLFKDEELQAYYDQKEWYQQVIHSVTPSNEQKVINDRMNRYELANKSLLEDIR